MATKKLGRVVCGGMGGFLCPPEHPEHRYSVQTDLRRLPENRGHMSLSHAVTCEYLADDTKHAALRMLARWEAIKLPIGHPDVQDWVHQVLGYFKGAYRSPAFPDDEQWNVSNLVFDRRRNPLDFINDHAGIRLIRQYYPEFAPTAEHFASAYRGKKPERSPQPS